MRSLCLDSTLGRFRVALTAWNHEQVRPAGEPGVQWAAKDRIGLAALSSENARQADGSASAAFYVARSTHMAIPIPPPMHSVARPLLDPRRLIS